MKNEREVWYEREAKVSVTLVDVTAAAQALARGHLAGPVSAYYLARACAAVALLGAEMSECDETVILQLKCKGALGGFNVECTADGFLRGYTEKKLLEEFDGIINLPPSKADEKRILGARQVQVTRSRPGRILSQGLSASLDGYFAGSLQRKAFVVTEAAVDDEVEITMARGALVEVLPDSTETVGKYMAAMEASSLAVSSRKLLARLDLAQAELKKTTPLEFGCRCSPERALKTLSALPLAERVTLPPKIDITCHMCGRTFTLSTEGI